MQAMRKLLLVPGVVVMVLGAVWVFGFWFFDRTSVSGPWVLASFGFLIFAAGVVLYGVGSALGERFWPGKRP